MVRYGKGGQLEPGCRWGDTVKWPPVLLPSFPVPRFPYINSLLPRDCRSNRLLLQGGGNGVRPPPSSPETVDLIARRLARLTSGAA